jgi:RHS repeat-associated protein
MLSNRSPSFFPYTFVRFFFILSGAALLVASSNAQSSRPPGSYWLEIYGLQEWELAIDHDGDNFTAAQEYYSGTDPFDAASFLDFSISLQPTFTTVEWDSVSGALYQVLFATDMVNFSPILGPVEGNGLHLSFDITPPSPGFFCLEALKPEDFDKDGLSGVEEGITGTDPQISDTDLDSILDGDETLTFLSDPTGLTNLGGTIRGRLFNDADGDGDLTGASPVEGAIVYLDANFNGVRDPSERKATTDASGDYEFLIVPSGVHHVRQELPAPNVQTFPEEGVTPVYNLLPDEVTNYTHAAPGVGNFDVPYGENASDWPGNWGDVESSGATVETVVSVDLVLKPIGVRNRVPGILTRHGSEFVSLPQDAHITLRFDEVIIDGQGADFLIYSINSAGATPEAIEVLVGPTETNLTSIGIFSQALSTIAIDLFDHDIPGPVQFVKCISQNNGGDWFGFELVGMEAINIASPDPGAHVVVITSNEVFNDRDFGRYFRDLPPTVILSATDNMPATSGLRAGETITASVSAFDDISIASVSFQANGQTIALDADNEAVVTLANPGSVLLEATATDSGGQMTTETVEYYVLNSDGSFPFDPNQIGQNITTANAPKVRILTPGAGTVSSSDVVIIADIIGTPPATSWTVEYAPVDDIDPYDLTAADADYVQIATGSGNVYSSPVATIPLSTLADGIYFVRVCAKNSATQTACFGQVIAKNVAEADLRPVVTIDSPTSGDNITMTVDITGTITSTRPLREWYAEVARADQVDLNNLNGSNPDWRRFASGTTTINTSALIANFDGTRLKNNGYIVRVVAWNDIGLGWAEPLALEVTGGAKFGRNRLEFRDLSINLAGFPLQFVRVYDSLQSEENGELGFGWSLKLQDPDIRETVPETGVLGLFGSTPFRDRTRVYVTAPTGERLGFTFKPEVGAASGFGSVYKVTFVPDPGVYHTLEIPEGDLAFLDLKADGNVYLFFFAFPYNPSTYVLTDPDMNRFTYHEKKGFLQAEDRNGNKISLNENGIDHSSGLRLSFQRDSQERITKVIAPDNAEWLYTYDVDGNLETVTDPDGRTTTYSYITTPAHYLDAIVDPLGRMPVRYEYDPLDGRLVAVIDEANNRQEVTWDPAGFTGSVTDARGYTTQLEYDARGNITRKIDPLLNETLFEYNDPNNPDLDTAYVDARGKRYESIYNPRGQLAVYRMPNVTGIAGAQRLNIDYDSEGNILKVNDFGTRKWNFTYDAKGNLVEYDAPIAPTERLTYTPEGLIAAATDGTDTGFIQNYTYDAKGVITGVTDSVGYQFGVEMSKRGLPIAATDGTGGSYAFDYDARGVPTSQQDPAGNAASVTELPDGSFTRTNRDSATDSFKMTSDNLLEEYTQPNGGKITPAYNENRRLETISDPLNNTVTYAYNEVDLLVSITDALSNALTIGYDDVGQVTEIVSRTGKRRTFVYDDNRQLTFESWYDGTNALIREFAFTYSGGGLETITDTQGSIVHIHDIGGSLPRPARVTTCYHGAPDWRVSYNWGAGGDDAPGATSVSIYKGLSFRGSIGSSFYGGRSTGLSWSHPGSGGGGNSIEVRRGPQGEVTNVVRTTAFGSTTPKHSRSLFTYDARKRLESIRHEHGTNAGTLIDPSAELIYSRDAEGRISSVTQPSNIAANSYDVMGQLTDVAHSDVSLTDESYAYDINGNRSSSHLQTTAAVVGAANRLSSIGDFAYDYDAEGNMTKRTNTATNEETLFTYDHRNQLVEATVHPSSGATASATVRFDYDFIGRLMSREINGAKTWIIYDRQMPIAEFADGATELNAMFFYSPNLYDGFHAVWRSSTGERWFLKDELGSVRGITDAAGAMLSWVDYDAFGNLMPGSVPAGGEPCRFAGRFYVEELGLYEYRRRMFDPHTGRFIQEDPTTIASGDINFYRYAFNSPHNFRDPLGTSAALESGLLDAFTARVEAFCAFGNCVGNLWSGVVRGVVNAETTDGIGDAIACAMDLIEVPYGDKLCDPMGSLLGGINSFPQDTIEEEVEAQWKFLLGGPANNVRKKANKLTELVLQCAADVRVTIEPVEIPPSECGTLRGLADGKGPFFE